MKRLGLAAVIFLVGGLVSLGGFVALADRGGPGHGADHGVATGLQHGDDGDQEVVAQQENGKGKAVGTQVIAQAIAEAFTAEDAVTAEALAAATSEVMALHAEKHIGWGALFKLYAIAQARGMTVAELLEEIGFTAEGEHDFAFGKMINDLSDEERQAYESLLDDVGRNLGQLVSAAHHQKGGGAKAHGHGKPAGVPAGGGQ